MLSTSCAMLNNFFCPSEPFCMHLHPVLCPSLCPGRLTALDYIFRLAWLLTSRWVQLIYTSHWLHRSGREKNEVRVLFLPCPVAKCCLCSCIDNSSQRPSLIVTDFPTVPSGPGVVTILFYHACSIPSPCPHLCELFFYERLLSHLTRVDPD